MNEVRKKMLTADNIADITDYCNIASKHTLNNPLKLYYHSMIGSAKVNQECSLWPKDLNAHKHDISHLRTRFQ